MCSEDMPCEVDLAVEGDAWVTGWATGWATEWDADAGIDAGAGAGTMLGIGECCVVIDNKEGRVLHPPFACMSEIVAPAAFANCFLPHQTPADTAHRLWGRL